MSTRNLISTAARAIILTVLAFFAANQAGAAPYASHVTNNAGTIQFILNESCDNAYVLFDNGAVSNSLGALPRGAQSFALGAHTNYTIAAFKIGSGTPTQISVEGTSTLNFPAARGLAVNANPQDWHFGLVYVANSSPGNTASATLAKYRGLYIMNADTTDVFGRGTNVSGGVFSTASSSSPYRANVGPDGTVYVGDFSTAAATVWKFDPEVANKSTWTNLLAPIGEISGNIVHQDITGKPCVTGSLATSNLVLYTDDAALGPVFNSINQYTIGAGPVPYSNAPVQLGNIGLGGIPELNTDMALGADGKLFGVINRANVAYDVPSVVVFAADGVTPLWDSITGPGNQLFVGPDVLLDGRSIAVSPDDQWMAVMHTDSHFSVMRLTNGVPDASSLFTIANAPNPAGTANTGAQIAFDAADNIYAVSRGQTNARIWSIGATTTAFTHNDLTATNGTFVLTSPATKVTVVATTPQASQTGPVPGVFTIARSSTVSDETNVALTVSFTLSGTGTNIIYEFRDGSVVSTATNITYVTNNTVITQATYPATVTNSVITTNYAITATVTFLPNINTTNITIVPDTLSVSRPTTAVALTVKGGGNYTPAPPVKDTVFIANSGPQYLFVSGVDASTMYRGYSNDYASFVITRWGDTTVSSYSVANYTYAGTATINSDYYGAGSISMDPGVVSVTNQVLRTEIPPTGIYVGNKSIIVGLGSGGGTYTAGPNTAALTLIDNASTFTNVLFSNPLTNAADATNWVITYGTGDPTNNSANYNVDFGYDLTTDPTTTHGTIGLPPNGATTALRITCNKLNNPGAAGGVNVYLTNQMFSGNFAVHFDMNVIEGANLAFSTEGVLFGLNHTGSQSNWWYGTGPIAPQTWGSDGLWYWVSADPGGAGAGDFLEFTGAGGTNGNAGWQQPGAKPYTTFAGVYKIPTIFTSQEGNPQRSGVPANGSTFNSLANTNWSNVEIKQYKATATGYITTMSINNYNVFTYTNNTVWTNGYVMLGYADPFGGTGGTSVGYPDAAAYFSNLKVVGVPAPVIVQQPTNLIVGFGSNATFTVVATFDPTETITNGQWYLNGVSPIPSQTNQTLSFTVGKTNYGSYNWTINDGTYVVSSAIVTLRPPVFSVFTNPVAGFVVAAGISTNLTSAANSFSGATNFQWQINNVNIPAATNRIYNFISGPTNYGTFRVIINDNWNFYTSSVAVITPPAPSIISVLPTTRAAVIGSSPTFTVVASTFSGLTNFQWLSNSVSIAGSITNVLTLTNVQSGNFGSLYTVRVTDGTTVLTSSPPVTLTLAVPQTITSPAVLANGTQFSLGLNTEFGPAYVVESKTNLLQASWLPLSTNAGTGGAISVTNNVSGNQGYFRVRLQ